MMKNQLCRLLMLAAFSFCQVISQPSWADEDEREASPEASIDDVAWIAGIWGGEALGGDFQETWNRPLGSSMVGVFKLAKENEVQFYEILTIVEAGDSLALRLKHFGADLVGWEEKDKSVEFPLTKLTDQVAQFSGLTFTKQGPNRMLITVLVGEEKQQLEFRCVRQSETGLTAAPNSSKLAAMQRVLAVDQVLSVQRNVRTKRSSLTNAVRNYVQGLELVDYSDCPDDFVQAYQKHLASWKAMIPLASSVKERRGEMHVLLEALRKEDDEEAQQIVAQFDDIIASWEPIVQIARAHGVDVKAD